VLLGAVTLIIWLVIYALMGVVVLAVIPAFRITLLNLVTFVVGAFAGSTALLYASGSRPLRFVEINPIEFVILGAAVGGTLVVWLKIRFIKTPPDTRLL